MKNWFSKNLGDAMLSCNSLTQIENLFSSVYSREGKPKDMAAFVRHESEGRLHCEVMVYFSPSSDAVAREVDAAPCEQPSEKGLSLLAGSEGSWTVLFPESAR
jgi:hypothetical protein